MKKEMGSDKPPVSRTGIAHPSHFDAEISLLSKGPRCPVVEQEKIGFAALRRGARLVQAVLVTALENVFTSEQLSCDPPTTRPTTCFHA